MGKFKFDVAIGNPPYQEEDGGAGKSAKPLYQLFIDAVKGIDPEVMTLIIPARWYAGGKGLNEFRANMLSDKHMKRLVDYENFRDVFPGVDLAGGVCFFVRDEKHTGPCDVYNCTNKVLSQESRFLDEYPVFIRSNEAIGIVRKVQRKHQGKYMDTTVSASKPFGIRTFYKPKEKGIPCQFIQRIGLKYADPADITDNFHLLNKWKLLIPRSPIAGQTDFTKPVKFYYDRNTRIIPPGTCCTESFLVAFNADTKEEVESFKSYLYTKIVRFLLLQSVVSQDVTREKFRFVPALDRYEGKYTDEQLCKKWDISDDEWKFIDSKIGEAKA